MKKIWTISFLIGIIAFMNSCDNEIDLTAEFRDIPIVYGILSRADSTHYIKIQQAFLGQEGDNALEIAQIADSLYYEELDVSIERTSTGQIYVLNKVDGNLEGQVKEEGVFADEPNYLYKLIIPAGEELEGGEEYVLRLNRGDEKPEVTASTRIISDFTFTQPIATAEVNLQYRGYTLRWRKTDEVALYDVKMAIHYLEQSSTATTGKTIIWNIEDNVSAEDGSTSFAYEFDGESFYRFLGAELDDNDGFPRFFQSLDFIVDASGEALSDYINIGQANTGITSSQVIPNYTNLSEGLGVFSSHNRVYYEGFNLKGEARDSLANGIHTRDLNFQ
jgi:hypothetical protein